MDLCQKDPFQDVVGMEKAATAVIEASTEVKEAPLVNGVIGQESEMSEADVDSSIGIKLSELQISIDNEMNQFEADEISPKLNDALTDEQKIELKLVLSNYFSHEHLSKDKFLISQMDYDQFIPVSIVAGLEDVKRVTQNLTTHNKLDEVIKTLQEIQFVQLNSGKDKVRRVIERSTLLLREVPKTVPEKDIRGIFSDEGCPPVIACEFAHNDSWYVHFGSEEDASQAYRFLRESKKLFLNKPILARFKGKSALTGSFIPPQSSDVHVPPASAPAPPAHHSSMIAMSFVDNSNYGYAYPEQNVTFYPIFSSGCYASPYPMGAYPAVPMNFFYPTTGDSQTTVELINARQRKPNSRYGGGYHGRSDQAAYSGVAHEQKQPPRFNRKRAEVAHERESESRNSITDEHHSITNHTSRPSTSSRPESLSSTGPMSPPNSDSRTNNSTRYAQKRGGNRGRRNRWNQDGVANKRHEGAKPPSFELETSSFPPLSSGTVAQTNNVSKKDAKTQMATPAENAMTNRVDRSTATDAGELNNSEAACATHAQDPLPGKISYAQVAKRLKEPVAKVETTDPPLTATSAEVNIPNIKAEQSPKEKECRNKQKNRPQRPNHEDGSKDRQ